MGLRRDHSTLLGPRCGIAPDYIVAAIEARIAEFLIQPDQGQAPTARLALIRRQQPIQLLTPRAKHWQRLDRGGSSHWFENNSGIPLLSATQSGISPIDC